MTFLIGGKVKSLMWMAHPPKFYEVELDENGEYVLDFLGCFKRTGRVIKGMNARKLMEELQRVRGTQTVSNGYETYQSDIKGRLPKQWMLDQNWEYGYKWTRNANGEIVRDRLGNPIPLPKGQKGNRKGRRHVVIGSTERGVTVADTCDLRHITWWKERYPDIPWRRLSRDYFWHLNDGFVTEVLADDAEVIMLSCVGEFLDVTKSDGTLPDLPEPIIIGKPSRKVS